MTAQTRLPQDPDSRGVPEALRRAQENARRLAEQTGAPFVVREISATPAKANDNPSAPTAKTPA